MLLSVNFDPALLQLLKEVKYLKILDMEIPPEADEAFKKNDKFRTQISGLENIKALYNNIILQLNEVEAPMVQAKLNKVEKELEPGLNKWTWEMSDDITSRRRAASRGSRAYFSCCARGSRCPR